MAMRVGFLMELWKRIPDFLSGAKVAAGTLYLQISRVDNVGDKEGDKEGDSMVILLILRGLPQSLFGP